MEIWFTSDTHFGHENIIRYCGRPFKDAREMDECLVEQWNLRVKPSDHIYHLGDITMARDGRGDGLAIVKRLNGHKRLIMGNHDHYKAGIYLKFFEKVMAMQRFNDIWFMHVPCHPTNLGTSTACVHGHIHQNPSPPPVVIYHRKFVGGPEKKMVPRAVPYINICVEQTNYHPVTLEEIRVMVRKAAEVEMSTLQTVGAFPDGEGV